jgi:hypothetical protein
MDTKIFKNIEINKEICFSFDIFRIHKDILKYYNNLLNVYLTKIPVWNWLLIILQFGIVFLYHIQL